MRSCAVRADDGISEARPFVKQPQCTLRTAAEISGVGLFTGRPVRLRALPAPEHHGLVFARTDLPGSPRIPVDAEHLIPPGQSLMRATGVRNGDAEVSMIEHLMATVSGMGVDNLLVECDSPEMPVGDGSALTYVAPFQKAGIVQQNAPRPLLRIEQEITVTEKDVLVAAAPQEEGLTLTYVLDYGTKFFRSQVFTVTITPDVFVREIAPARTFCLRPEIEFFQSKGVGRGASLENTIIVESDGRMSDGLRFPDECVRHKVLDLLGDLFLAGRLEAGRILGYKSGHTTNVRMAQLLRSRCVKTA